MKTIEFTVELQGSSFPSGLAWPAWPSCLGAAWATSRRAAGQSGAWKPGRAGCWPWRGQAQPDQDGPRPSQGPGPNLQRPLGLGLGLGWPGLCPSLACGLAHVGRLVHRTWDRSSIEQRWRPNQTRDSGVRTGCTTCLHTRGTMGCT